MLIATFLFLFLSFIAWRKAVILLMYWLLLVGAVRKWIAPEMSDLVFFSTHIALTGVYIRFFTQRIIRKKPLFLLHPLNIALVLLVSWGLISLFNPRLPDFRIGLLGLVIHFYFIPLIYIIPDVFQTKKS